MTGAFEILSVDPAQKRIGIALVEEGSSRAAGAAPPQGALVPGAIVTGRSSVTRRSACSCSCRRDAPA